MPLSSLLFCLSFDSLFLLLLFSHSLPSTLSCTQIKRQGGFRFLDLDVCFRCCSNHVGEPFPLGLFPAQVPAAVALVCCL